MPWAVTKRFLSVVLFSGLSMFSAVSSVVGPSELSAVGVSGSVVSLFEDLGGGGVLGVELGLPALGQWVDPHPSWRMNQMSVESLWRMVWVFRCDVWVSVVGEDERFPSLPRPWILRRVVVCPSSDTV